MVIYGNSNAKSGLDATAVFNLLLYMRPRTRDGIAWNECLTTSIFTLRTFSGFVASVMVVYTVKLPRLKTNRLAIRRVTRAFKDLQHAHLPKPLVDGVPLVRVRPGCDVLRLIILKIAEVGGDIIPWANLAYRETQQEWVDYPKECLSYTICYRT